MMIDNPIFVAGCAPELYPTETFYCLLYYAKDQAIEVPKQYPYCKGWGIVSDTTISEQDNYSMPRVLDIVWLSVLEKKFFMMTKKLPYKMMEDSWQQKNFFDNDYIYGHIVIGMAPYGGIAVWLHGRYKSTLVTWQKAEVVDVDMEDFMPQNPKVTLNEYCDFYINSAPRVKENLERNGLPPSDLFDNYMKQFTYRYQMLFERWDEDKEDWKKYDEEEKDSMMSEFDFIEEALFDGTHDKLHDGGLMNYHEAGKPKKLAVQWHLKKSEWTAYFWFEDQAIRDIFDRFYGAHRDTKTDFILHFDPNSNKYELALYRYGLREPQVIPESAYQLIVFKNKFESFRSDNYAQERGAWIW